MAKATQPAAQADLMQQPADGIDLLDGGGPSGAAALNAAAPTPPPALEPPATPAKPAKPGVGRIVHFYNHALGAIAHNSQGAGPYPAIVVQAFPGAYVNLRVLAWDGTWAEGSVEEKSAANATRYWEWPPRD